MCLCRCAAHAGLVDCADVTEVHWYAKQLPCCWIAEETLDRDRFQSADEAREFGLIDEVIEKRPESAEVS